MLALHCLVVNKALGGANAGKASVDTDWRSSFSIVCAVLTNRVPDSSRTQHAILCISTQMRSSYCTFGMYPKVFFFSTWLFFSVDLTALIHNYTVCTVNTALIVKQYKCKNCLASQWTDTLDSYPVCALALLRNHSLYIKFISCT